MKQRWWLGPLVVYFCMLAAMLLFALVATPFEISGDVLTLIDQWAIYAIALGFVYLHVRRYERRKKFWESVGVRRKNLGQCFMWLLALLVVFTVIMALYWQVVISAMGTNPQEVVTEHFEERFPDWYFAYMFLGSFIPVGISEELIFRGFMLDRFLVKGPIFAILVSSFLFSSLHLWYAGFGVTGLPLYGAVFLLAVFWGIVYWKTRNVVGLAIFHGLNNVSLSVNHFLGTGAVAVMNSALFIVGMVCLGYFILRYIRGLFRETEALVERMKAPVPKPSP
jgi:membrane protease YdiL (CAAX protease family)